MAMIQWDKTGERFYETGVKNGVLFVMGSDGEYEAGIPWNGLISVSESPEGGEPSDLYADDTKYLSLMANETYSATIEAYTYPKAFEKCDGSEEIEEGILIGQQTRTPFAFCYKTTLGNDVSGNDLGYKIHIVYGCFASPSQKDYSTINDSPEAITFSWTVKATPVTVTGKKPTATVTIDSTKVDSDLLAAIENKLYGTTNSEPTIILPDEFATLATA